MNFSGVYLNKIDWKFKGAQCDELTELNSKTVQNELR